MKNLIVDMAFPKLNIIDSANTPTRISGVAAQADTVNGNGRVYPRYILEREISRISENLDSSDHVGMVDHPSWSEDESISSIGLKFTKLWLDGNDVRFEAQIIPTTRGRDLEAVVRAGVKVGISSRGEGSEKVDTFNGQRAKIIQDDFTLWSYDAVVTPAVANARISQYESRKRAIEELERVLDKTDKNSSNGYNTQSGSIVTTENTMEKTTQELIRLVKEHLLKDEKDAAGITPANEVNNEEPREQVWADPADNPNEQPNPQPDPMNRDTSPLTHTTENPNYEPIPAHGNHPDPTMGEGAVSVNEGEPLVNVAGGSTTTENSGLNLLKQEPEPDTKEPASLEGEFAAQSVTKHEDEDVKDMLLRALDRQSEITTLRTQLTDAQVDAGIVAALAALSTSVSDHLSRGDWSTVSNLSNIGAMLSWYAESESYDSGMSMDALKKNDKVKKLLQPIALLSERIVRDEKIVTLTDGERYGRTIAARLRTRATTADEAEKLFQTIKDQVLREANALTDDVAPKGNVVNDKKFTPEQIRLRELAGIHEG